MARGLPTSARLRVDAADPIGRIEAIQVRPAHRAAVVGVSEWDLASGADHGTSDKRAVTLIQAEHLPAVSQLLGRPADSEPSSRDLFAGTRRNLLVSRLNLSACHGRQLAVGEVVLELTVRCHPCRRMDEAFGVGGFAALFGHGGWCARIVKTGVIRVGDPVRLADVSQQRLF